MTIKQTMWKDSAQLAQNVLELKAEINRLIEHEQWVELRDLAPSLESHAHNICYAAEVVNDLVKYIKEEN